MSVEDKIKKAEEIYYRRKEGKTPNQENKREHDLPKINIKLIKKLVKQVAICLIIYGAFFATVKNNYVFSEDFTNKSKEILSQDIDFANMYSAVSNKITEIIDSLKTEEKQENNNETNIENNNVETNNNESENIESNETENNNTGETSEAVVEDTIEDIQNNDENIGGAEEAKIETLSQMEQDANSIKSSISFIKPVSGRISSKFGLRNPTTPTVPKNHTGTDIAVSTGTEIISATNGEIVLVSSQGDFGKHLEIQVNDVIVLYAHCSKIYVKEGDKVTQGQVIAKSGATGNVTGPHLHFEIRYQNRLVDPELILDL